jgi:hypothetical protein
MTAQWVVFDSDLLAGLFFPKEIIQQHINVVSHILKHIDYGIEVLQTSSEMMISELMRNDLVFFFL